ncbi:MAG: CpsD/CapB family tyrosine-protein kinase [Terriglobales bacterium]
MGHAINHLSLTSGGQDDAPAPDLRLTEPLTGQMDKLLALPALPGVAPARLTAWEQLRVLRTRILDLARERDLRRILVTSAVSGEGKTLIAANLALSLSQLEDKRVLVVDADLRRPSLQTIFARGVKAGLSDCLDGGPAWTEALIRLHPQLDYLPCRPAASDSVELLNRRRLTDMMDEFTAAYDLVVVDSAPMSPIADTQVLARLVDGAVLVVRSGLAPYQLVRQAAQMLEPKLLGVVLNGLERVTRRDYAYGYYAPRTEEETR